MSQRFGALKTANDFSRLLATKPAGRSGGFWVHIVPNEIQSELGFILPKRHVKRAVWRNQIKRWSKANLRRACWPPVKVLVRVSQPLKVKHWALADRRQVKQDLEQSLKMALESIQQ